MQSILSKFAKKYSLDESECLTFVKQICTNLLEISIPLQPEQTVKLPSGFTESSSASLYSTRYYRLEEKVIRIQYDSRLSEYYIHPPFEYLEILNHNGKVDRSYKVVSLDEVKGLFKEGRVRDPKLFGDFVSLRKHLYIDLAGLIFNKSQGDWLSFVHASAVSDGHQTILLASDSGSGKSTMAAFLQARGLTLVSDDFVPIEAKSLLAYPFPAAPSVKKGAFSALSPFYGDLENKNYNAYPHSHASVRYLPIPGSKKQNPKPKVVRAVVFLKYNPEARCNFTQIPVVDALSGFHEQAWVSSRPDHARIFIDWFVNIPCYTLEYGDNEQGIEKIVGLFGKDALKN
jgi:hypothetical protein